MNKKFFLISLFGHAILFLSLACYLMFLFKTKKMASAYIPSYVIASRLTLTQHEKILPHKKSLSLTDLKMNKLKSSTNIKPRSALRLHRNTIKIAPSRNMLIKSSKDEITELLKLLHQKIAMNQIYPESAQLLQQSGTVRIGFQLFPNGDISNISILKSSGFASIDSSALSALKKIIPVQEASAYLQKERFFSVDVIFE